MMYIFWAFVAVLIVLKLLGMIALSWWWIALLAVIPVGFIFMGIFLAVLARVLTGR